MHTAGVGQMDAVKRKTVLLSEVWTMLSLYWASVSDLDDNVTGHSK